MRNGMTLMSVMVAVALAGIVALAVARLLGNQSKTMSVVRLREQREELLKHYKNIVISGWDVTERGTCSGVICSRTTNESGTNVVIPTANGGALYLADDLYNYNYRGGTANKWWRVSTTKKNWASGSVLHADSYAKPESLVAVEVTVEFLRKEHPVINTKLATRKEIVFLHHNTSSSTNRTMCDGAHLTKMDKSGSALYAGTGAIIQYDFNSNYTKCSQVPLVNARGCGKGAVVGFFRSDATYTKTLAEQLIEGNLICSTDVTGAPGVTTSEATRAGIRDSTEKRTVKAINCENQGYVEWIDDDEEPKCVGDDGSPVTDDTQRVVAISQPREVSGTHNYTLYYLSTPGGDAKPRDYPAGHPGWPALPQAPAGPTIPSVAYSTFTCPVTRYKGIHAFKATGKSGEIDTYTDAYDGFGTVAGPPGAPGPAGVVGPAGPPGPTSDCFLCCKDKTRYTCDCETDTSPVGATACSLGGTLSSSCNCSSFYEHSDSDAETTCEDTVTPIATTHTETCSTGTLSSHTHDTQCDWINTTTPRVKKCSCTVTLNFATYPCICKTVVKPAGVSTCSSGGHLSTSCKCDTDEPTEAAAEAACISTTSPVTTSSQTCPSSQTVLSHTTTYKTPCTWDSTKKICTCEVEWNFP